MRVVPQTRCGHRTTATKVQACRPRLSVDAGKVFGQRLQSGPLLPVEICEHTAMFAILIKQVHSFQD